MSFALALVIFYLLRWGFVFQVSLSDIASTLQCSSCCCDYTLMASWLPWLNFTFSRSCMHSCGSCNFQCTALDELHRGSVHSLFWECAAAQALTLIGEPVFWWFLVLETRTKVNLLMSTLWLCMILRNIAITAAWMNRWYVIITWSAFMTWHFQRKSTWIKLAHIWCFWAHWKPCRMFWGHYHTLCNLLMLNW